MGNMQGDRKPFNRPPKKYQPKGLPILHEDHDILVVDKVSGLSTVSNDKVMDNTAYFRLNEYVRKGNSKSRRRVFIVHRLDRDTSGVIVFAKSENAQKYLQDNWHTFQKTYMAVVHGTPPKKEGMIESFLAENAIYKMYSVTDPEKGKYAATRYRVLRTTPKYSLLEIDLLTGRKNQIRVHMADQGHPVVGDKKYGTKDKGIRRLTLHAASMVITHPHSREKMTFTAEIPRYFETLMRSTRPHT